MIKNVNGVDIECSPEEEAQILAIWAEFLRAKTPEEINAEKNAKAALMDNQKLVYEAILEAVFDMKQNPGNYQTADSLKLKVRQFYRAKL